MSSLQKQAARMYNNNIESIRESGDRKKNLQENIGNITAERDSCKKCKVINI